jgi:hypothetical protein
MTTTDITISQLDGLCEQVTAQRAKVDELAAIKAEAQAVLDGLENKLIETLENLGRTSYPCAYGTFGISARTSVKVPATPEDRQKFFDYLKEKGIYEQMITVHSATLNSFYKKEFEIACEEGKDLDVPGLGQPALSKTLSVRKAK